MWIRLLIAIKVFSFLSKMWRTQICGHISFDILPWSVYYVRGHRSEGTCILEDIDLSMTSEDTDLRKYVFESQGHRSGCDIKGHRFEGTRLWKGHGSEYDVMIGHGSESYIYMQCLDKVLYRIILFKCVHEFIQITKLKVHVICTQLRISVF